jgi:hypothetical protein
MEDDAGSYVSEGSLSSIEPYGIHEGEDDLKETTKVKPVRESVKAWKMRELDKTTENATDPEDMSWLRKFVKAAALLFSDLMVYVEQNQNKDENMKDDLYVKIVVAIGAPHELTTTERYSLENVLNRDLIVLPLTIDEDAIDERAKEELHMNASMLNEKEFVEEEVEEDANAEES